jgi:hypothetical protein
LSFKVLREGRIVISKDYFWFTRAGYWIKDVIWQDGLVLSGSTAAVGGETPVGRETASIAVCPNPGRRVSIQVWPVAAGTHPEGSEQLLEIHDIGGRLVRTLGVDGACAAPYISTWDGTDTQGKACSPGIYYLSFGSGSSRAVRSVVLVR